MKTKKAILTLILGLVILHTKAQVDEQTKFKMFCTAFDNSSTSPNYVVVNVKNARTGETKEICTEAPFLAGAIGRETGIWKFNCNDHILRYFEFSNDSSLFNIDFELYTKEDLSNYAMTINVSEIVMLVKSGKLKTKTFTGTRKDQIMFAHLMYNNGVMMIRGCVAGNICDLIYFDK